MAAPYASFVAHMSKNQQKENEAKKPTVHQGVDLGTIGFNPASTALKILVWKLSALNLQHKGLEEQQDHQAVRIDGTTSDNTNNTTCKKGLVQVTWKKKYMRMQDEICTEHVGCSGHVKSSIYEPTTWSFLRRAITTMLTCKSHLVFFSNIIQTKKMSTSYHQHL